MLAQRLGSLKIKASAFCGYPEPAIRECRPNMLSS